MAYSFQTFTLSQILTAAQMNQVEVNIRDHQHGVSGVFDHAATQADQEAGTSVLLYATPGRQHFHPSAAKGWCQAGVVGDVPSSYNVTSVTDTATGRATINWNVDFSSASYCAIGSVKAPVANDLFGSIEDSGFAAGVTGINAIDAAGALVDPVHFMVVAFGDRA